MLFVLNQPFAGNSVLSSFNVAFIVISNLPDLGRVTIKRHETPRTPFRNTRTTSLVQQVGPNLLSPVSESASETLLLVTTTEAAFLPIEKTGKEPSLGRPENDRKLIGKLGSFRTLDQRGSPYEARVCFEQWGTPQAASTGNS